MQYTPKQYLKSNKILRRMLEDILEVLPYNMYPPFESIKDSVSYAAPENSSMWWAETMKALNDNISETMMEEVWAKEVKVIVTKAVDELTEILKENS